MRRYFVRGIVFQLFARKQHPSEFSDRLLAGTIYFNHPSPPFGLPTFAEGFRRRPSGYGGQDGGRDAGQAHFTEPMIGAMTQIKAVQTTDYTEYTEKAGAKAVPGDR